MSDIKAFEEKQKSSRLIFDGTVLHVYRDEIYLPNGKEGYREFCRHNGAVCVVPVTDEGEVILVRQYRYAVGQMMLEIPAGKLDTPDEDPTSAALRELREETGATCRSLTYMGVYFPSPAILTEKIHVYLAEGLEFGENDLDDDEFLEVLRIPMDKLVDMIVNGEVPDGKTQMAVLRAEKMIKNREKL
jgi:ADP-ribose pyrophosphatase